MHLKLPEGRTPLRRETVWKWREDREDEISTPKLPDLSNQSLLIECVLQDSQDHQEKPSDSPVDAEHEITPPR